MSKGLSSGPTFAQIDRVAQNAQIRLGVIEVGDDYWKAGGQTTLGQQRGQPAHEALDDGHVGRADGRHLYDLTVDAFGAPTVEQALHAEVTRPLSSGQRVHATASIIVAFTGVRYQNTRLLLHARRVGRSRPVSSQTTNRTCQRPSNIPAARWLGQAIGDSIIVGALGVSPGHARRSSRTVTSHQSRQ